MRSLALAAAAVATVAITAAPAGAATLNDNNTSIEYNAAAGETNQLRISRSGGSVVFTDPGATITPAGNCALVAANPNQAACPFPPTADVQGNLGDMADTLTVEDSVTDIDSVGFTGGLGNDQLTGGDFTNDSLAGEDGADRLFGRGGRDSINPGTGAGDLADEVDGGAGQDGFSGSPGNDIYRGGPGEDFFSTTTAPDGSDLYDGGPNRDAVFVNRDLPTTVSLDGLANDGTGGENDNMLVEQVQTGNGNDVLTGSAADETFSSSGGSDRISAGAGNDNLSAGDDNDVSNGGPGDDNIFDGEGNDSLLGGDGNDELSAGPGSDTLNGEGGDDTLQSGFFDDEPDVFVGGPGIDRADYSSASGPVAVDLDGQADDGVAGEGDNVGTDMEDVVGSEFADTLVGNDLSNELIAGEGNDVLRGAGGQDGLHGERGADNIDGGNGRDSLEGEDGADRIRSRDRVPDAVSCGGAADVVLHDARDRPDADCDEVSSGVRFLAKRAPIRGRNAVVRLTCPEIEGIACRGRLSLANARGRLIGRTRFAITPGRRVRVRVTLVPQARRARSQKVTGRAQMTDTAREQAITTARLTLFRP